MLGPRMDFKARPILQATCGLTLVIITGISCSNGGSTSGEPEAKRTGQATYNTPTKKVALSEWPALSDDLDFQDLKLALQRQLERFNTKDLSGTIQLGDEVYPMIHMRASLEKFLLVTESTKGCLKKAASTNERDLCYRRFQTSVMDNFDLFEPDLRPGDPRYGESKTTFFTAYYTPLIYASSRSETNFRYPIYKRPQAESLIKSTRQEIDFKGKLSNQNLELFYARDLFELYLLHVQGGGKIITNDGQQMKTYYLSYQGGNGHKFTFISKYMMSKGYIKNGSIESQKEFLDQNPELYEEIYSTCPNYIYFQITDHPPLGNDLVPLTDNRSIATDSTLYAAKGLISFVKAQKPVSRSSNEFTEFSRFMLDQDTGGAIKGKARADLYFGEGAYAEKAAYSIQHKGNIFYLMLKKSDVP